jgi:hypothetical protein
MNLPLHLVPFQEKDSASSHQEDPETRCSVFRKQKEAQKKSIAVAHDHVTSNQKAKRRADSFRF